MNLPRLGKACVAEATGTFVLVVLGTGAVFSAALTGSLQGLLQVALVWGLGVALAVYATASISGAHLNPAVTVASAVLGRFPARRVLPYIGSQVLGGFLASAVLFGMYGGVLEAYEKEHGLQRGAPGSQRTAMVFGEYFPNPADIGTDEAAFAKVGHLRAMLAEVVGTGLLVFLIFALTDPRNGGRPDGTLPALLIGMTVTVVIAVVAPLTQACLNPARDLGPRLFSLCIGYGAIAIPGPRGGFFTVYILSPIIGGIVGGGLYQLLIARSRGNP